MPLAEPRRRYAFVDNLRALLPVMVIVVHTGITYGSAGEWFYKEGATDPVSPLVLTLLVVLAGSFGMGFFFMIAGYFTPASADRKGPVRFVADRLVRLGIPLLAFGVCLGPIVEFAKQATLSAHPRSFVDFVVDYAQDHGFVPGPLWFVETLIVFSAGYALVRLAWPKTRADAGAAAPRAPGTLAIVLAALGLTGAEFAVRFGYRPGEEWHHLQLGYFPQYIIMFALGVLAYRRGWIAGLPERTERVWSYVALALMLALPGAIGIAAALGGFAGGPPPPSMLGGWNALAIGLAIWESFFCIAMAIAVPSVFRRHFNRQGRIGKALAENSYGIFFLHAPVLVGLGIAMRHVPLPSVGKFLLVAPATVAACLVLSHYVLRRVPGVRAVL
jgi:peptidoglycan/LPS O-acetylase OafA/YrhL